jgi:hypothetical protein
VALTKAARAQQEAAQINRVISGSDTAEEQPLEPDIAPDRTPRFRTVGFSRMRVSLDPADAVVMEDIARQADEIISVRFAAAYALMERIYRTVRQPQVDPATGEVRTLNGRILWMKDENGLPAEDFSLVGDRDRENWIHEITVHSFEWGQEAAGLWGRAIFTKGMWEEAFAHGYTRPQGRLTVDDRTQAGTLEGMGYRYKAIFAAMVSRKADALVRSIELIGQRLKDTASI